MFVITMTKDEFLKRLDQIGAWKHSGRRAPHKPLLLLLALGRVLAGRERLAPYKGEIDNPLTSLLKHFGPPRQPHHPEAPFATSATTDFGKFPDALSFRPPSVALF